MLDAERPDRPQTHQHRPRTLSGHHPRPGLPAGAGERSGHRRGPRSPTPCGAPGPDLRGSLRDCDLDPRRGLEAEVRGATWDEIDLDAAAWAVPAERMKAAREHRVPLSDRALTVLDEARRELPQAGNLVFPSQKGGMQGPIRWADAEAGDRRHAAWIPVQLSGLGRLVHRDAAGGLRTRPGARQQRPRRGRLPAHGPVRPPPDTDAGVGRLRSEPDDLIAWPKRWLSRNRIQHTVRISVPCV